MHPVHLGQYLVNQFGSVRGGITPLKLQKLVYYVKAWSLVDGEPLVDGAFERWKHGPVNRALYEHFKGRRAEPIQPVGLAPEHEPQGSTRAFVDFIGHSYIRFPAVALSKMTHDEDPWRLTKPDQVIADALIQEYYSSQPFAQNLPFDPDKPYVPVLSHMDTAFTLDMNAEDAARANAYASYRVYLERLERAGYVAESDWLSRLLA